MARARFQILDRDEEELVHAKSIESLENIGVLIRSSSVLGMLKESGAEVDPRTGIAKFSEGMVNEALERAPKSFTLGARERKNDIALPVDGFPKISTDGLTLYMIDPKTGERRNATRKDLADFAKLADALDPVEFFWPIVTATDVMEAAHSSHEMWTSLISCTKHIQGDVLSREDALTQIKLGALVAGGDEELRKRPLFSAVNCPIAPLSFEKGAVEAQVEFAKAGVPTLSMSMSLSGMSSPVTFAGTVVNANTENLASLVITESAQPGAPHIFSSESAPIDMLTGNMNYSAPEMLPISAAMGQMSKRYNRPCMTGTWGMSGNTRPGMKGSFCETVSTSYTMFCNTDLGTGMGGLDDAKGCAFEQLVIDAMVWDDFRAFFRQFKVDEESCALDVVKEVGQGNSFLTHPHTAKNFKKELHFWDKNRLAWQATLSDRMVPEAKEMALHLLEQHVVTPVDPDIVKQGDVILKEYERSLIA